MGGKRNVSVCRGHELANALYNSIPRHDIMTYIDVLNELFARWSRILTEKKNKSKQTDGPPPKRLIYLQSSKISSLPFSYFFFLLLAVKVNWLKVIYCCFLCVCVCFDMPLLRGAAKGQKRQSGTRYLMNESHLPSAPPSTPFDLNLQMQITFFLSPHLRT